MTGLLDGAYSPDPLSMGLLGLGSALMTPRALGGGIGPGMQQFAQQAMAAQQMQRQMQQDALRQQVLRERSDMERQRFGFERERYEAGREDTRRQQQVIGQVRGRIESERPELLPLFDINPQEAIKRLFPQPGESKVVAPGSAIVQDGKEIYRAPERTPQAPWEYEPDPQNPGRFRIRPEVQDAKTAVARAGATNIGLPKIELKTGESMAGQIGPMLKDSATATQGAVNMADAAQRTLAAIERGGVIAGPGASLRLRGAQVASLFGFGGKDAVAQTRQVVRALAESSIEARKELQGQGQVTESEAKAVQKAMSGDIDDLTVEEIRDISRLNIRASVFRAQRHNEMLQSVPESASGLRPFYAVPRAADLLRIDPKVYAPSTAAPTPGQGGWQIQQVK